jgi:hypothetical protein
VVPRRLAMVEPVPGGEFRAQLGSFRLRTNPQELHLVDILCPASFRVDQLPGLIRALLKVRNEAKESGLLSSNMPVDQPEPSCKP